MVEFPCQFCQTRLSVPNTLEGQMARCPQCRAVVRVPNSAHVVVGQALPNTPPPAAILPTGMPTHLGGPGRRYGFSCGYCSSRLEAVESMAAQDGQCPTCGNNITIPILDRHGRLIDPKTRQIIRSDPHPVHAYAAAGGRAPKIIRQPTGEQSIQCPRCIRISPITANNCQGCGMPFTMEGTTAQASTDNNGYCIASLILGVIGLPSMCFFVPSILAIIFGIVGLVQIGRAGHTKGRGLAIGGIVTGAAGLLMFVTLVLSW
jgi:uncharacterized C2H2 Zn-finger protein